MPRKERPDWYANEIELAGAEHLDPGLVAAYDRKSGDAPSQDAAALPLLGLDPGATVVDMGAGTGTFALAAAALGYRVGGDAA